MEYRKLPHGEEQISILGLGSSSIGMAGEKEIQATVELALERLGVDKENAVYVGDSQVDVDTAKAAGLPCIAVTW